MNKSINPAKVAANQRNALRSTGPKDTTSTRFNAAKHGLLAQGITELDDADGHLAMLQCLNEVYRPVGDVEVFRVERVALGMVRLRRAARMEAEYTPAQSTHLSNGPHPLASSFESIGAPLVDPGLPASIGSESADLLATTFQRYEAAIENKLYRAMNQLERLQRIRHFRFLEQGWICSDRLSMLALGEQISRELSVP